MYGGVEQILADRFERKGIVSVDGERNAGRFGGALAQLIVQRNGLKDGAKFVIGTGAPAKNVRPAIGFGERWDSNFAHAPMRAWVLVRTLMWLCRSWCC